MACAFRRKACEGEMRGGARPGAGRPKEDEPRKMRSLRARDAEWRLIKEFEEIVKNDPDRAERILKIP